MQFETLQLKSVSIDLGELHDLTDFGFYRLRLQGFDSNRDPVDARMRLHITQDFDNFLFIDPRALPDHGLCANSAGSPFVSRKADYTTKSAFDSELINLSFSKMSVFQVNEKQLFEALALNFSKKPEKQSYSQKPSHIAFTCHDPGIIGGGNKILFQYIEWLKSFNIHATIYSCGKNLPKRANSNLSFKFFKTYRDMMSSISEDIIVLFSSWHMPALLDLGIKGKTVFHLKQTVESYNYGTDFMTMFAKKPILEILESLPFGALTASPHLLEYYQKLSRGQMYYIPNGVDTAVFHSNKPAKPKPTSTLEILSVGHPSYFLKGADTLAQALVLLANSNPNLRLNWTLVSGIACSAERTTSAFPQNLKMEIKFGLNAKEMQAEYARSDVFVNSSRYEGFGLPSLEAMACGLPVVQLKNKGLEQIAKHEVNCLLVDCENPELLANSIHRTSSDATLRAKLIHEGLLTSKEFSIENQQKAFHRCFSQILAVPIPEYAVLPKSADHAMNDHAPLVSVVIPTYNQASYLPQALDCLKAQRYQNWEAIVVNDGSTDNTSIVIDEYSKGESRIRGFSKQNGGITSALNFGVKQAKGDFFCWLSSDDLFHPNKLEVQVAAFNLLSSEHGLVYSGFDLLHEEDNRLEEVPMPPQLAEGLDFAEGFRHDFIDGCTIMVRMALMKQIGGFNPHYRHSQDFELWLKISSMGYKFSVVAEKTTIRRIHRHQSSTGNMIHCRYDAANIINFYLNNYTLLEVYKNLDLSLPGAIHRMLTHACSRMDHTEANVNHPLNIEAYWSWLENGIESFPLELQPSLFKFCLEQFKQHKKRTSRAEIYIALCKEALQKRRNQTPVNVNFGRAGPDIRKDDRFHSSFCTNLFFYALDLFLGRKVILFGQELTHHNTNKFVNTAEKLGITAIQYLSQFANTYQHVCTAVNFQSGPADPSKRSMQYVLNLAFPAYIQYLLPSLAAFKNDDQQLIETALAMENAFVKSLSEIDLIRLIRLAGRYPHAGMYSYWVALYYRHQKNYPRMLMWLDRAQDDPEFRKDHRSKLHLAEAPTYERTIFPFVKTAKKFVSEKSMLKIYYWRLRKLLKLTPNIVQKS